MAAKPKTFNLKGGHTAGIFADMTVDGPVIGTLVAIVDRAKNLPNRKTIGKQDPYCAARLGKEAKKTTTDIRGGQTPKWDQELRFTVHDSPDYYQLKMSVFNDDKKTDLIGEAWIDLKDIIVPGGGQNDMWQGLTCRGKYAGEIRVEITFYDSRPRPERPAAKQRQRGSTEKDSGASMKQRPVKRRPLPSDPVTGETPVTPPIAVPAPQEQVHTPRSQAKSASQSAYMATRSPLQSVEYNTSPQGARPQTERDPHTPSPHSAHRHWHRSQESYGGTTPLRYQDERGYSERSHHAPIYDQHDQCGSRTSFSEAQEMPDDGVVPSSFEDCAPPPPPAHGSRQNSAGRDASHHHYDISPQKSPTPMRQDVLRSEANKQSAPSYPGQPVFKAYDPSMSASMQIASRHDSPYDSPASQHLSRSPGYSPMYSPHHRSMQPTVEDDPDSPSAGYRQNGSRAAPIQEDLGYHAGSGMSSQIVRRSPGASGQYHGGQSPLHDTREHPDTTAHPRSVSPLPAMDYSNTSSQVSHASQSSQYVRLNRRNEVEHPRPPRSSSYAPPEVPLQLSAGVDLALSQEFSDRSYNDQRYGERYSAAQHATPTRGRHHSEEPPCYTNSSHTYAPHSYDGRSIVTYSSRPAQQATRPRNSPSPNPSPQHLIRRKSVSPAPPSAENRRLSDIPFSPDSYVALNPSMNAPGVAAACSENVDPRAKIIGHDGREIDPSDYLPMDTWAPEPEPRGNAKQPSPEPRARPSTSGAQPMPPPSGRRPLRIAARPGSMPPQQRPSAPPSYGQADDVRTPPASGRNRLQKKAGRPSTGYGGHPASVSSSPLAPMSTDWYQESQMQMQYTPTRTHRGRSFDRPNENHAPQYGSGPPIPAKMPLSIMSGAHGNGDADMSLMEELQRIDIGAGRSRRRRGY
ncbi:hypothetical protein E4U41_005359 [Claviceps citrina]|nr:hypothetical protein E4U41_005359 [Claviceps citrina]